MTQFKIKNENVGCTKLTVYEKGIEHKRTIKRKVKQKRTTAAKFVENQLNLFKMNSRYTEKKET